MSKKNLPPNPYISRSELKFWLAMIAMTISLSGFMFSMKGSIDEQSRILTRIDNKISEHEEKININTIAVAVIKNILKIK